MKKTASRILTPVYIIVLLFAGFSCKDKEYTVPVADFTYTLLNECSMPLQVQFSSKAENAEICRWDFGDGTPPVYGSEPVHLFQTEGVYMVDLTVYSKGGMHSEKKPVYAVNVPQVDFSADRLVVNIYDTVRFTAVQLTDILPAAWLWNFGDGSTSVAQNPVHVYTSPGLYTVTLTAVNACGSDYEEKIQYIQVNAAGSPPVANFVANHTVVLAGQMVNFTDLSLNNPVSWNWSFPGGTPNTSLQQHPANIVYNNPGTYNVSLTASNAYGSDVFVRTAYIQVLSSTPSSADIQKITVKQMTFPPPPPNFVNLYFTLTDQSNTIFYNGFPQIIYSVTQADLPVSWTLNPYYNVNPLNHLYQINLYQKRMSPPDLLIGSISFNLNNYTSGMNPYPATVNLVQGGFNLDLQLAWM